MSTPDPDRLSTPSPPISASAGESKAESPTMPNSALPESDPKT